MRLSQMAPVIAVAALSLPLVFMATAADARGCGRHGFREGSLRDGALDRISFERALLRGRSDCLTRGRIEERRARPASHGGYYEIHGRYQH